jgi:hypothetical protein
MTTASTSAVLAQTTQAQFDAWVQEVYTNLVTNCGLTQANDTGQAAVPFAGALPTGTGVANATGYYVFTFNDALAAGSLSTTALNSGGSGYTSTGYTGLTVTGSTSGATNARASLTVSGGVAGNLTITTAGSGYFVGEKLTVTGIGAGTGANWTAAALSSGAPVIFRLDFGAGSATTSPQVWITLGAGTNGAGTIAGTAGASRMTQVAAFNGSAPNSTVTAYNSRYVYNSTYGYLGIAFKLGAQGSAAGAAGGLIIFRTCDTNGNATSNAVCMICNSTTTTAVNTASAGAMQCMSYNSGAGSTVYPTLGASASVAWTANGATSQFMFGLTATIENSIAFIQPIYTIDPSIRFSAFNGLGLQNDFPIGNTASYAMIGSTALTFISVGGPFGAANGEFAAQAYTGNTFCMLWQ